MKPYSDRHRGVVHQVDTTTYQSYDSSGGVPWKEVLTDVVNSSYRDVIGKTEDFFTAEPQPRGNHEDPTPHWFRRVRQTLLNGTVRHEKTPANNGYPRTVVTITGPSEGAVPLRSEMQPLIDIAYNTALSKAYAKFRSEVDLSVDLAQAHKVRQMFGNVSRLGTYVRGFNRKTISSTWLQFTYGWRPLAQTLHDSVVQVYESADRLISVTEKATVRDTINTRESNTTWNKSHIENASARCEVHLEFAPTQARLDQAARLTSLNPVSIAWELVPYSFVVDWFVDIGSYIRDVETATLYGLSQVALEKSYITKTTRRSANETWTGIGKSPSGWNYGGSLSGETVEISLSRMPITYLPRPVLPRFRAKLGPSRLLSAAALLNQLLSDAPEARRKKRTITTIKWRSVKRKVERPHAQRSLRSIQKEESKYS